LDARYVVDIGWLSRREQIGNVAAKLHEFCFGFAGVGDKDPAVGDGCITVGGNDAVNGVANIWGVGNAAKEGITIILVCVWSWHDIGTLANVDW